MTADHEAWNLVGYTARKTGDYDKSFKAYQRCLDIKPDYAPAREYLGEAWLDKGEVKKAHDQLLWLERLAAVARVEHAQDPPLTPTWRNTPRRRCRRRHRPRRTRRPRREQVRKLELVGSQRNGPGRKAGGRSCFEAFATSSRRPAAVGADPSAAAARWGPATRPRPGA